MAIKDAPFDSEGHLMQYADPGSKWTQYHVHEWRENKPFEAVLRLKQYLKNGSIVTLYWEDVEGHLYPMFFTEFVKLVQSREVSHGRTRRETWIIYKRGTRYGIGLHNA